MKFSFAIVDEAKTDEFPGGDLSKAWKAPLDTFEPSTAATKDMLKKQFYLNKLSDAGRDPDEWITELEILRQRLKSLKVNVDDEDLVIHILNNLPKEYDSLVESIEENLNKGADEEVTVKRVRERVRARFRRMALRHSDPDTQEDVALLASGKKVKTRCGQCGKIGHKKEDCWDNPKNKKSK
jgi:gag-polypeptide of LTR copia-type